MARYKITAIILTKSKHAQFIPHTQDDPNFTFTHEENTYNVLEGGLYRRQFVAHLMFIHWLIRVRYYYILFSEGIEAPLIAGDPKFSPEEIYLIDTSNILGKGLRSLIKGGISNRILIIIIVLLIVAGYYLLTGGRMI